MNKKTAIQKAETIIGLGFLCLFFLILFAWDAYELITIGTVSIRSYKANLIFDSGISYMVFHGLLFTVSGYLGLMRYLKLKKQYTNDEKV